MVIKLWHTCGDVEVQILQEAMLQSLFYKVAHRGNIKKLTLIQFEIVPIRPNI